MYVCRPFQEISNIRVTKCARKYCGRYCAHICSMEKELS